MLGVVLGFSGRIGRLRYFLLSTALAVAATAMIFAIVLATASHGASADTGDDVRSRAELLSLVTVAPFFLWFSLALQAKRIRDIGWQPILVIPAWIAANVLDAALAHAGVAPASGAHHGTAFGALVNLAMGGVLLFWPSGEPDRWGPPAKRPDPPSAPRPQPAPVRTLQVERTAMPTSFGRRGSR